MHHSKEEKLRILDKLMPPNSMKMSDVARIEGISLTTLYLWRRELGYDDKIKSAKLEAAEAETQTAAENWLTAEDKFMIVVETHGMTQEELEEYCEVNELIVSHVLCWRENCIRANEFGSTQLAMERQLKRQLVRENRRLRRLLPKNDDGSQKS